MQKYPIASKAKFSIQSKTARHARNQKNMTHYEWTNQSIKIDLELRDKLELAEKKNEKVS